MLWEKISPLRHKQWLHPSKCLSRSAISPFAMEHDLLVRCWSQDWGFTAQISSPVLQWHKRHSSRRYIMVSSSIFSGTAGWEHCTEDTERGIRSWRVEAFTKNFIYYLLTESEVITGKSHSEACMYWPSDSKVNTSRPKSEISLYEWTRF